jgi:hypothetical protein
MRYQMNLAGVSGRKIEVESTIFGGSKLLVDGQPAPKGSKRSQFIVSGTDGRDSVVEFKTVLPDPVPQVLWAGQTIRLEEPLSWYQWLWVCIPLVLMLVGGAIGGLVGAVAMTMNIRILRSNNMSGVLRYAATAILSVTAFGIYVAIARAFLSAIHIK